ncbi:MAG TPA: glyoxylate/hydroxypyruvate reductase A [Dokdonella sp.]|uniref:2-hydroxyacid dehydrogenase n=1 Tax=Dokdonella sp. TaxID=2291710 RepID=UPI002D7FB5B4|nr:glyoxylate/hydroxypyruvate reductase A [Dokdonella sp.]HET9034228.1 glyoxylate/hydroxypyruvate reductase A [Dokdonella sp.]
MDVLICTAKEQDEWCETLAACLPEAQVHAGPDAPACDYAVLWKPPAAVFAHQPRLKALFSLGAGVDGLLAMPALPRDVPLVRIEDCGMAAQMIEYALYVALRRFRRFAEYADAQSEGRWAPRGLRMREDFQIGVLGLGVLGSAVANALAGFGFAVSGWSRTPKSIEGIDCVHGSAGLDVLLARSEVLLVLLPLTGDTEGLLGRELLAQLPDGAALANLSRGEIVDDEALLEVLDSGQIAEAFLDVFHREPLPRDHRYWTHPRVRITPHVAALTPYSAACSQVAEKIRGFERGESISGIVDRARGY